MATHFVFPRQPTILAGRDDFELSHNNLFISANVCTAHVIPDDIDIMRFDDALARTLSVYPLCAGRLVRPDTIDQPWKIRLTNSGIPVQIIYSDADQVTSAPDRLVQTPLTLSPSIDIFALIDTEGTSDVDLMKITITRFTKLGRTSIGVNASHCIADSTTHLKFMRMLSQYYQGLDCSDPLPYYEPQASGSTDDPSMAHLPQPLYDPTARPFPWDDPSICPPSSLFTFRMTKDQYEEIHQHITEFSDMLDEPVRLSRLDVLIGLIARAHTACDPKSPQITKVMHMINQRGMGILHKDSACNGLMGCLTQSAPYTESLEHGILAFAQQVRKTLLTLQDTNVVRGYAATVTNVQRDAAWRKKGQAFGLIDRGTIFVNSTYKFDYLSPHFGYEGRTLYYYSHPPGARFVKMLPPNPRVLPDGTFQSRKGDVEVVFFVPTDKEDEMKGIISRYAKTLGVSGEIEFPAASS